MEDTGVVRMLYHYVTHGRLSIAQLQLSEFMRHLCIFMLTDPPLHSIFFLLTVLAVILLKIAHCIYCKFLCIEMCYYDCGVS